MAKLSIVKASTDVTVYIFVQNSSLTTGAGLTGLVFNSASLVCYYVRPLAVAAALTLATQTVTGAHSDGGFVEVDATNMPGVYRLDLSDAVCATGVNSVVVMLKGATNMAPVLLEIQLTSVNLNDSVRGGMTALPNAAADAAGGLPISDAGGLDLDARLDAAVTSRATPAQVNTEVDTALADARLDELLAADSDIDGVAPPTVGSVFHELLTKTAGSFTYDQTTDSLEALRDNLATASSLSTAQTDISAILADTATDGVVVAAASKTGYALSAAGIQAIWDALTSALTTVGSIGKLLVDNINATISSRATQASVDTVDDFLDTEVAAIKAKTDSLTFTTANQVDANALAIDSSTSAATHLKDHSVTAVPVTFSGGTTTTAVLVNVDGAAASSIDDFYNGRVLIFTAPAGLKYQATDITDYVGATKTATITAVTTAVGASTTAIMV